MKKIKLSVLDDSGNVDFEGSPLWRHSRKLSWQEVINELDLEYSLISRLSDWQRKALETNIHQREERVKCEIEGLAILLELRKELPDYEITYSSNFNSYHHVLNEEQVDDSY